MSCQDQIYSNDYCDFIIDNNAYGSGYTRSDCNINVDNIFTIEYLRASDNLPLSVANYDYSSIPKCFALVGEEALEATGIPQVWNQPALELMGQGVLIGFIDSGIDYQLPVFRDSSGATRIVSIWDQSIPKGAGLNLDSPQGPVAVPTVQYGTLYGQEEINTALQSEEPLSVVPSQDTNGHGTYVASVAAGSMNGNGTFSGGAPRCDIAMVKLKEAKPYLKNYYYANTNESVYSESDILTAISYLDQLANERNQPLVLCVALGTSAGSHGGNSPMSLYLDIVATRGNRCIVCATGNEASDQHHFYGNITNANKYLEVEVEVENEMAGYTMELWAVAPQLYEVALVSPTGEVFPRTAAQRGVSQEYRFIFEETTVSIDYRTPESGTGNPLIFFRFVEPAVGLWRIRVYLRNFATGSFHMYLPMQSMLEGNVFFLRSNPDTTIVSPANAVRVISVGGYNEANDSLYLSSGRGYTLDGHIKPDFVAPAVNVSGAIAGTSARAEFLQIAERTGTSASAAFASAAAALYMEWSVVDGQETLVNTTQVKNFLIRGAIQKRMSFIQIVSGDTES